MTFVFDETKEDTSSTEDTSTEAPAAPASTEDTSTEAKSSDSTTA